MVLVKFEKERLEFGEEKGERLQLLGGEVDE